MMSIKWFAVKEFDVLQRMRSHKASQNHLSIEVSAQTKHRISARHRYNLWMFLVVQLSLRCFSLQFLSHVPATINLAFSYLLDLLNM